MRNKIAAIATLSVALSLAQHEVKAYTISVDTNVPSTYNLFDDYIGSSGTFDTPIGLFSGSGIVYASDNSTIGNNIAPQGNNAYMAVIGAETIDLNAFTTSFSLIWGSPDSWNNLALGGLTINGAAIADLSIANGSLVIISNLPEFATVEFTSSQPSFEFSLDPATRAIPEPTTWLMMLIGFAGLGYTATRRRVRVFQ